MRAPRAALPFALIAAGLLVLPASAAPAPAWDTTSDAGLLGSDRARRVVVSPRLSVGNQALDTVVVAGDTYRPSAVPGGTDRDVASTGYDAVTGAVRWTTKPDAAEVGVDSTLAGLEINENNNLFYEVINRGSDILYRERSLVSGAYDGTATVTEATAADSASDGAYVGIAGSKGTDFLVAVYQTGTPLFAGSSTPTAGSAASVDMPVDDITSGVSLAYTRALVATGTRSGFGTGGDLYTAGYLRDGSDNVYKKVWDTSWASPDNKADAGAVAEIGWVDSLATGGKDVAFVVGKTFTPATGWDIIVTAYDLSSGATVWSQMQRFNGTSSKDDVPVAAHYSRATETLYVTGTSNRAPTTDQDVVVLAFDGATGAPKGEAYSGGVINGDDSPTGITATPDGTKVLVSADVTYSSTAGAQQSAIFGYDAALAPTGSALIGGAGNDFSAGLVLSSTADRVLVAGSSPTTTGDLDHRATAFRVADFAVTQEPVVPEIPWAPLAPVVAVALAAWWVRRQSTVQS
jgi:hypothetical protein